MASLLSLSSVLVCLCAHAVCAHAPFASCNCAAASAAELVGAFTQELKLRHAIIREMSRDDDLLPERERLTQLHLSAWVLQVYISDEHTSLVLGLNAARPAPRIP